MTKKILNAIKYLLGLALGLVLLYLAMRKIDFADLKQKLEGAQYIWVLIALIAALFSHFFRSLRWNMLLHAAGSEVDTWNAFAATLVNYLVNQAIPRGGEVARCTMIYRSDKVPVSTSLGTVISERVIDLICLLSLIGFFTVTEFEKIVLFLGKAGEGMSGKVETLDPLMVYVLGFIPILGVFLLILFRKKLFRNPGFLKLLDFVKNLIKSAKSVFRLKKAWLFFLYTFLIWSCYAIMTYLPFLALPESSGLGLYFGLLTLTAGGLGMAFPSPGGVGSYHIAVTTVFVIFLEESMGVGAANTLGGAIATIIYVSQLLMIVAFGFLAYLFLILRSPKP